MAPFFFTNLLVNLYIFVQNKLFMKKYILILVLVSSTFFSCSKDEQSLSEDVNKTENTINESYNKGKIRLKLSASLAEKVASATKSDNNYLSIGVKSADNVLSGLGVTNIKRTFPYCGKFEARTHAEGLDLWYDITFDTSKSLTKAKNDLSNLEGVDIVEYLPKMSLPKYSTSIITNNELKEATKIIKAEDAFFDDPQLPYQWHYYNDGSNNNQEAGCDIDVVPVWKNYTTGNSDVIVAVIDQGVDISHEDLSSNIWVNDAEKNGATYSDDDDNGYVDDINGYNFAENTNHISVGDHGTHIAGTIAAVNNNGIGVCGIAGGDKKNGIKGVSIMSCELSYEYTDDDGEDASKWGSFTEAIKYAADNGAVIAQNSWGYLDPTDNYVSSSDKAAIDYFVKYAGIDENGEQYGPMKGGIVIFAAGNDNGPYGPPSNYDPVVAVSALASDFEKAYYSNYGSWADIAAPGGDYKKGYQIISTLPNNSYGKMQGTSMACPHVSGVAALLISHFGGKGFTNEMLKERLLNSTNDIIYNGHNQSFTNNLLGSGLVDTYAAFTYGSTEAPNKVTTYSTSAKSNNITINFTLPSDDDDIIPYGVKLYYSKNELSDDLDADDLSNGVHVTTITTNTNSVGDNIEYTLSGLDFNTTYYLALQAYDSSNNNSDISDIFSESTLENHAPVITADPSVTDITLHSYEDYSMQFSIYDPDEHSFTTSAELGSDAATLSESLALEIKGNEADEGTYKFILSATDEYDAETSYTLTYTILPNTPPNSVKSIDNIIFNETSGQEILDLDEYFTDADGESLTYTSSETNSSIAHANSDKNKLYITALDYGENTITVTASDAKGETASLTFKILVRNGSKLVDLYPNPVKTDLNIRPGEEMENTSITIRSISGNIALEVNNYNIGPFNPTSLDLSGLAAGVYSVTVSEDSGIEYTENIIKL